MTAARVLRAPSTTLHAGVHHKEGGSTWLVDVSLRGLPHCVGTRLRLGLRGVSLCVAASTASAVAAVQEPWQAHQGRCASVGQARLAGEGVGARVGPGAGVEAAGAGSCVCTALLPLLLQGEPGGGQDTCEGPGAGAGRHLVLVPVTQGAGSGVLAVWVVRPGRWRPDVQAVLRLPPRPPKDPGPLKV